MAVDKDTINIIHLDKNKERRASFMKQIIEHKLPASVWPGIIVKGKPWTGISRAYKQVVQYAKNSNLPYCIIADDDFLLSCPESYQLFLRDMPSEFDLYMGGISGGTVDEKFNNLKEPFAKHISFWSGTFFFAVHERFYDVFLSADEDKNIDRWFGTKALDEIEKALGRKPVYKVRYPFICTCIDGISDNSGKFMEHRKYFLPYQIQK